MTNDYLADYESATWMQRYNGKEANRYHRLRVKALKGLLKDHGYREVGRMVGLSHSRILQMVKDR